MANIYFFVTGASDVIIYHEGSDCNSLEPLQEFRIGECTGTGDDIYVKVAGVVFGGDIALSSYISGDGLYFVDEIDDGLVLSFHLASLSSETRCHAIEGSSLYEISECRQGISNCYSLVTIDHMMFLLE